MKLFQGMYYPDGERHMIDWVAKNGQIIDGRGIYQAHKQHAVYAACKQRRTAIDIGAHIGHWSLGMAGRFRRVIAFEPVDEHADCFERNVLLADDPTTFGYKRIREHVSLRRLACGSAAGQVRITRDPNNSGASHVAGAGEIEMVPLDAFGFDDVDLIKMDVEGYEANVIAGARDTILRCRPIVCAEQKRDFAVKFGLKPTAATDALRGLGMKLIQEIGGDFIFGW
jgi:FkbM family methyltransferase